MTKNNPPEVFQNTVHSDLTERKMHLTAVVTSSTCGCNGCLTSSCLVLGSCSCSTRKKVLQGRAE
jgi:hypothetical protein